MVGVTGLSWPICAALSSVELVTNVIRSLLVLKKEPNLVHVRLYTALIILDLRGGTPYESAE